MMAKLSQWKDKVEGYVDKAQDKAVGLLVETLHPKVHSVIDTRVDGFRDSTLEVGVLPHCTAAWDGCRGS
jgi:hypothetical protein